MVKERTFVLVFPYCLEVYVIGDIVMEFEKNGLTVIGLNKMTVRPKFAQKHFHRTGRIPSYHPSWVEFTVSHPVVAMLLEGEDAINKVHAITSRDWKITLSRDHHLQIDG
ncbi:Nucleoside diphosphate kinase [Macleaya cordata]|uniref:nucleoside-diphosphate kinase n=1 Tax=Macleaya cordata TaxID=56857 RepID=A0A200Q7E6_MACCD|nr:Nucleoside diphosphate kinase [Macleaya cordata]